MNYSNILILLIATIFPSKILNMEKPAPVKPIILEEEPAFFKIIPRDAKDIIMEYLFIAGKTCKESCQAIKALGQTDKVFSQALLYDPNSAARIVQTHARRYRAELDALCFADLAFAAAYQLNTPGAKEWLKEQYFTDPKNFKIISASFFETLNIKPIRSTKLKQFMLEVLPKAKDFPPLIKMRLSNIRTCTTLSEQHYHRYTPETKKFMEILGAQITDRTWTATNDLKTAICRNNALRIDQIIAEGNDVDLEDDAGHLPLICAISNYPQCIPQLLQAGANPNNREGLNKSTGLVWPPLQLALSNKIPVQYIESLLAYGANPESGEPDYPGKFIRFAIAKHPGAVKVLLQHSASLTDKGLEEIEFAKQKGKPEAVAALEEYRQKRIL